MLRDHKDDIGNRPPLTARNVLGEPLEACSTKPMTGLYRDGCCNTGQDDIGSHTVCAVMTAAFLDFSKSRGNDLSTPVSALDFPGLKPGDRWGLCAPAAGSIRCIPRAPHGLARAMRALSLLARSPISNASQWICHEFERIPAELRAPKRIVLAHSTDQISRSEAIFGRPAHFRDFQRR